MLEITYYSIRNHCDVVAVAKKVEFENGFIMFDGERIHISCVKKIEVGL